VSAGGSTGAVVATGSGVGAGVGAGAGSEAVGSGVGGGVGALADGTLSGVTALGVPPPHAHARAVVETMSTNAGAVFVIRAAYHEKRDARLTNRRSRIKLRAW
jgi:hypothetical protein